ncbi:homoserine dehydrogenase [Luteipulveratus halotolerans]|uniref:Homoserine dehydrogenase n=1 Tax=Luteipulveratus halotolerans TaxID=1631356 RepID=A0A0L6CGA4_9MICO|nr:homoserine dehydrogenase [Luteipulveratus halotolerans]KNX36605.1 homoserine dehydrogenase [Luteipulveratus halotolerans]
MSNDALRIALLGCGTVGTAVARRLVDHADEFASRVERPVEITGVAVRDTSKPRPESGLDPSVFTTDAEALVRDADVVVELMGGIEPARSLLLTAMEHGASVVTANKALLGEDGPRLYETAAEHGVDLYYEASVAGAIPLLRPLQVSLAGDSVERIMGIVNGTTNFILDKMDRTGEALDDVLAEAQELGYAEADPTADVEGYDARAKAAILASLAFHTRVAALDVSCEGIMSITADDIRAARKMGCVVKLLAICERVRNGRGDQSLSVRVHPTLVPRSHPLASVHDAFNAVFIESALAGEVMFYGQGAGGDPTASAVLGDLVQAARHKVTGSRGPGESAYADLPILPLSQATTRYAIRIEVPDRPGVLAHVTNVFAGQGVSIESMRQGVRRSDDGLATLTIATHAATDAALARTVDQLRLLDDVSTVTSVLRMEGI